MREKGEKKVCKDGGIWDVAGLLARRAESQLIRVGIRTERGLSNEVKIPP